MDVFASVREVTRRFGATVAVDGASLDVARGELLALLGPSGCGKTTLLRTIGGLETPDSGEIELDGRLLNGRGTAVPPEKRGIVLVFQDFALFPHMTVAKNVAFGMKKGAGKWRVDELLEMVGLAGLGQRMPHQLSGGQQQRVALARALAPQPRLILLDEPFSNLDPSIRERVRGEVRALLREVGIAAIFVTHDQNEALSLADRVAVMIAGRIMTVGTPHEVYTNPGSREVAEFVGHPNFVTAEARDGVVTCALGQFAIDTSDGPCDLLVRAEHIVEAPSGGVPATVLEQDYFGHEVMVRLKLADGSTVQARWPAESVRGCGDCVHVAVDGPVSVFRRAP